MFTFHTQIRKWELVCPLKCRLANPSSFLFIDFVLFRVRGHISDGGGGARSELAAARGKRMVFPFVPFSPLLCSHFVDGRRPAVLFSFPFRTTLICPFLFERTNSCPLSPSSSTRISWTDYGALSIFALPNSHLPPPAPSPLPSRTDEQLSVLEGRMCA